MRNVTDALANQLGVTEEEKKKLLPSGAAPVFYNRTAWAKTYLKKAGLLDSPKQGIVVITKRGLDVLKANPASIDVKFLKQFSEFVEFQTTTRSSQIQIHQRVCTVSCNRAMWSMKDPAPRIIYVGVSSESCILVSNTHWFRENVMRF